MDVDSNVTKVVSLQKIKKVNYDGGYNGAPYSLLVVAKADKVVNDVGMAPDTYPQMDKNEVLPKDKDRGRI